MNRSSSTALPGVARPSHEDRARAPDSLDAALVRSRVKERLLGQPSRVCVGRFELLRRLGQGGEGTVYEARDRNGGKAIALKQLHPTYTAAGGSLKREFRALSDLVHPNLVTLHELFHVGGQRFYTMALIEGVDFVSFVRPEAHLPDVARLRATLPQLFAGLGALHAASKIHRDLKPSNVLVGADGRLVILDYGLVLDQRAGADEGFGGVPTACTPAYAAPEQIAGRAVFATDLYAVGVMLYLALTGRLPFQGSIATQLARSVEQHAALVPPSALATSVPDDLGALAMALLAYDPAERPTAASALAWCRGDAAGFCAGTREAQPITPAQAEQFVGRGALLSALHAHADANRTAPRAALLHGQSGIGKSALLRRFCAERAEAGAIVLFGRCYEREHVPYKALDAIVEQLVVHLEALPEDDAVTLPGGQHSALARLFPVFARLRAHVDPSEPALGTDASEVRKRAFTAVSALFRALAQRREVVFAVDDLQWGDLDSVVLLQHLLAASEAPPILLIGACRTEELRTSSMMQALHDALHPRVRRVELEVGPLPADDARTLLSAHAPPDAPLSHAEREACIAQASGVPFALHQLAAHARETGFSGDRQGWLGEVVRLRARQCSAEARRLLEVLAVAGRPLETTIALESCGETAGFHAAAELCGKQLARWRDAEQARCLEPYHDLVRAAVTQAMAPPDARAIHRAIAATLTTLAPDQPEHLVEHLLGAEEYERAGLTALDAAERAAAQFAWNRAAELLFIARRVLDATRLREHGAYERLALVLASANRHRESVRAYEEAAEHVDPAREQRRLRALAAAQMLRAGDGAAAITLLERLLAEVGYRFPRTKLGMLAAYAFGRARQRLFDWWSARRAREPAPAVRSTMSEQRLQVLSAAYGELWVRDPLRATLVHMWTYREARRARDAHWLRALACEIAHLSAAHGAFAEARVEKLVAQVDALAGSACTPYEQVLPRLARAVYALQCRWRPREALSELDAVDELLARHWPGSSFELSWTATLRDFSLELTGESNALLEAIAYREQRMSEHDAVYARDHLLMSVPLAHLLEDRADAAIDYVRTHWKRTRAPNLVDYAALARLSTALLYRGDPVAAHACLIDEWWTLRRAGLLSLHLIGENASYHRARNAAALYWCTRARALKRDARRRAFRAHRYPPVLRALYRLIEASVDAADGREAACRAALHATIDDSVEHGAGATEWCARYRLAELDCDARALDEASAWFSARGVRDPARWVALTVPGPPGFR